MMPRVPLLVLIVAVVLSACARNGEPTVVPTLTAVPYSPGAPLPSPSPALTPTPTPAGPTPSPVTTDRGPTDADRARFVAGFRPQGAGPIEHVAVDVDGDGIIDLVFAYIASGRVRVDIAWWHEQAYRVEASVAGAQASTLTRLRVRDINADGLLEIVTDQRTGDRSSLDIWQVAERASVRPLTAVGGCVDGSNTYGAVGAQLADRDGDRADEVYATCDAAPLPTSLWPTHVYRWESGAYRYRPDPTPTPSPEPSPTP